MLSRSWRFTPFVPYKLIAFPTVIALFPGSVAFFDAGHPFADVKFVVFVDVSFVVCDVMIHVLFWLEGRYLWWWHIWVYHCDQLLSIFCFFFFPVETQNRLFVRELLVYWSPLVVIVYLVSLTHCFFPLSTRRNIKSSQSLLCLSLTSLLPLLPSSITTSTASCPHVKSRTSSLSSLTIHFSSFNRTKFSLSVATCQDDPHHHLSPFFPCSSPRINECRSLTCIYWLRTRILVCSVSCLPPSALLYIKRSMMRGLLIY